MPNSGKSKIVISGSIITAFVSGMLWSFDKLVEIETSIARLDEKVSYIQQYIHYLREQVADKGQLVLLKEDTF